MPVIDSPVHEKVRIGSSYTYGCWNRPRPKIGDLVKNNQSYWPYIFSTECRFDMSLSDSACEGCQWRGSGEAYDAEVRRNGK